MCRKPYTLGETPAELVNKWGKATLDHYMQLYFSPEAGEAGGQPLSPTGKLPLAAGNPFP